MILVRLHYSECVFLCTLSPQICICSPEQGQSNYQLVWYNIINWNTNMQCRVFSRCDYTANISLSHTHSHTLFLSLSLSISSSQRGRCWATSTSCSCCWQSRPTLLSGLCSCGDSGWGDTPSSSTVSPFPDQWPISTACSYKRALCVCVWLLSFQPVLGTMFVCNKAPDLTLVVVIRILTSRLIFVVIIISTTQNGSRYTWANSTHFWQAGAIQCAHAVRLKYECCAKLGYT